MSRAWAAFFCLFGRPRPHGLRRHRQLERVFARLDRHGGPGAGLDVLVAMMVGHRDAIAAAEPLPAPATLAYFLPDLERLSRKWRRDQSPVRRANAAEHRRRRGDRVDAYEAQGRELRTGRR